MTRRLAAACALSIGCALAAAPPGWGSPPWSDPAAIGGSTGGFPIVRFTGGGSAVVVWGNTIGSSFVHVTAASSSTPSDGFGPAREVGRLRPVALEPSGPDQVVVLGEVGSRRPRAVVAFGPATGPLAAPAPIGPRDSRAIALAVNRRGDAAALVGLCELTACSRMVPALAIRRAGGRFGRPVPIGRRQGRFVGTVAINERGDVLVAWERAARGTTGPRNVYARIRTAGGSVGSTRRLARVTPSVRFSAAIGDGRRAVVGWLAQRVSEGFASSPATIGIAAAPPRERFGPSVNLETVPVTGTGLYVGQAGVAARFASDGRLLLAWTGYEAGRFVVRAAGVSGTAAGPPQIVSDPAQDTVLSDLAVGSRGEALVLGLSGIRGADPAGPVALVAATRAPGAEAFGGLELVTPGASIEAAGAAFDPVTGAAVAVWRDYGSSTIGTARREPAATRRRRSPAAASSA